MVDEVRIINTRNRKTLRRNTDLTAQATTHEGFVPEYMLWISKVKISVEDLAGISKFSGGDKAGMQQAAKREARIFLRSEFAQEIIELLGLREAMKAWASPSESGYKRTGIVITRLNAHRKKRTRKTKVVPVDKAKQERALYKMLGLTPEPLIKDENGKEESEEADLQGLKRSSEVPTEEGSGS